MNRLVDDNRSAVAFLNYPRPVSVDPQVGMGPNLLNEHLWPVEISDDRKRVGFSLITPPERIEE